VRAGRLITDVPSIEASCIAVCCLSHHQRAHSSAGAFRSDLEGEGCDIPFGLGQSNVQSGTADGRCKGKARPMTREFQPMRWK
jgi:hypothetical protein